MNVKTDDIVRRWKNIAMAAFIVGAYIGVYAGDFIDFLLGVTK